MTEKHPKRPRDTNQRAKAILDLATMDEAELKALRKKQEELGAQKPGSRGSRGK